MKVLLLEDDAELAFEIVAGLRDTGFSVDAADSIEAAEIAMAGTPYDCLVLDRSLPDGDSLALVDRLRRAGDAVPILLLTARALISDRIAGFEHGADDYLVKPFAFAELVVRIRALLRRRPDLRSTVLQGAGIRLDVAAHRVSRDGVELVLTAKEFAVLELLMERSGRAVTRTELIDHCWDGAAEPASNVVDVAIAALRRRLGPPDPVTAVRGVGYRFEG